MKVDRPSSTGSASKRQSELPELVTLFEESCVCTNLLVVLASNVQGVVCFLRIIFAPNLNILRWEMCRFLLCSAHRFCARRKSTFCAAQRKIALSGSNVGLIELNV